MANIEEVGMPLGVPTGRRPSWIRRLFPDRPEETIEVDQDADLVVLIVYCGGPACSVVEPLRELGFCVRHLPNSNVPRAWADRPNQWPGLNPPGDYVSGWSLYGVGERVVGFCSDCDLELETQMSTVSYALDL